MSSCVITDYNPYYYSNVLDVSGSSYYASGWHYFLYDNLVNSTTATNVKYEVKFTIPSTFTKAVPLRFYCFALGGGGNGGTSFNNNNTPTPGGGGSSGGWIKKWKDIDVTGSPVTFKLSVGGSSQDTTVNLYDTTWTAPGGNDANTKDGNKIGVGPIKNLSSSTTTKDDESGSASGAGWNDKDWVSSTSSAVTFADGTTNANLKIKGGEYGDSVSDNTIKTIASFGCGGTGDSTTTITYGKSGSGYGGGGLVMIYYYVI
jgi:hypothetical protein